MFDNILQFSKDDVEYFINQCSDLNDIGENNQEK